MTETAIAAALRLDEAAVRLLRNDVARLTDGELAAPTPCADWSVADLLAHMTAEHERIVAGMLPAAELPREVRLGFEAGAARWIEAFSNAGAETFLPSLGRPLASDRVLSVHFVDMLVHRWDLASALGRPCVVPEELVAAATPIAEQVTAPGSPLVGPGRAYGARVSGGDEPFDRIVAMLGRDPAWTPG
jgi:uncharacterized protein (TIGR03086 family)